MRYVTLYRKMIGQAIKVHLSYRVDLVIGILSFFVIQGVGLFSIKLMYNYVQVLAGWTFNEILLIYSLFQIPRGIDHLLTDNVWLIPRDVRRGLFDKYLTKPINILFHICVGRFQFEAFGELILGVGILVYVVPLLGIQFTLTKILLLIVYILIGTIIYFSIKLISATLSFWMKDVFPLMASIYEMASFSQRPIEIYPRFLRVLLTYILPFAFTAYYPARFLLDRNSSSWILIQGLIIASIFLVGSYQFWLMGIRRYDSSGS